MFGFQFTKKFQNKKNNQSEYRGKKGYKMA